jgi:hypothetical protein
MRYLRADKPAPAVEILSVFMLSCVFTLQMVDAAELSKFLQISLLFGKIFVLELCLLRQGSRFRYFEVVLLLISEY